MSDYLYAAYVASGEYNVFGGRVMLGYAGWHSDNAAALAEAERRYPDYVGNISVTRA